MLFTFPFSVGNYLGLIRLHCNHLVHNHSVHSTRQVESQILFLCSQNSPAIGDDFPAFRSIRQVSGLKRICSEVKQFSSVVTVENTMVRPKAE